MSESDVSVEELEDFDVDLDNESDCEIEEVNFRDLSWEKVNPGSPFHVQDYVFYGLHGLHPRYEERSENEIFFFEIIFPDEIFEMLADFTNVRAHIFLEKETENLTPKSRGKNWKDVSANEMKKFFACLFLMGIVKKPTIESFWSTDGLIETPFFSSSKCLSRDRFQSILRFLRFADYNRLDRNDPLRKISHFVEKMKTIIQNSYMPSEKVAVDKVLLLFKGRLYFRNFIPSKRSRYGIKIFALVDEYGYLWNFHVHTVASDLRLPSSVTADAHLGFSGNIVASLMSPLFDMNYVVFCDNFFISEKLAEFLITKRTHLCGTTRFNRLPKAIQENFPKVGENPKFFRKERILISCFSEKKQSGVKKIAILDTKGVASTEDRNIRKKGGGIVTVKRPKSLSEYNKYMGMVDETDAVLHPYDCTRKSMNWTTKVGIHLMQRMLMNAYSLHRQHTCTPGTSFLKFSLSCIQHLFDTSGIGRRAGGRGGRPKLSTTEVLENHCPSKIPSSEKKKNPSLRCRVCSSKGIRKETRLCCNLCQEKPPLCAHPCFNVWHNYS